MTVLDDEHAARLLRAKAGELEARVLDEARAHDGLLRPVTALAADLALIAQLLAEHIDRHRAPAAPPPTTVIYGDREIELDRLRPRDP